MQDQAVEAVAKNLGIKVRKVELLARSPSAAISAYLEDKPADLIVLATHGREGPPRWLRPSVSEPVARNSKTATLFIPHGARGFVTDDGAVRLERVLVPIDQKPDPQPATIDEDFAAHYAPNTGGTTTSTGNAIATMCVMFW